MPVEAGWYAVVQVPAIASEETIVLDLLEQTGVLVHPGYFFDFEREAFLVVSLLPEPRGVCVPRRRRSSARSARADDPAFAPRGHQRAAVFASLDAAAGVSARSATFRPLAEWLRAANQSVLQILPLNELAPSESSPYSALSAMAIDPQFISIWMMDDGAGVRA